MIILFIFSSIALGFSIAGVLTLLLIIRERGNLATLLSGVLYSSEICDEHFYRLQNKK